ncbi:MAG: CBS domain-containing protein [Nitrospirales bacterium]
MRRVEMLLGRRDPTTLTAKLLMEDTVVTCSRQTSAVSVAMRLCDGRFGSIPIVEEDRTLSGLVSEFDLLKVLKEQKDLRTVTAEEIMTQKVISATEDTSFTALIELMQSHHLIRLPVLRGQTLVGVVSRRDILYGYLLASFRHEHEDQSTQ